MKRKVDEPLTRIVDDIDMQPVDAERAANKIARAKRQRQAQFRDAPRTVRPACGVVGQ